MYFYGKNIAVGGIWCGLMVGGSVLTAGGAAVSAGGGDRPCGREDGLAVHHVFLGRGGACRACPLCVVHEKVEHIYPKRKSVKNEKSFKKGLTKRGSLMYNNQCLCEGTLSRLIRK